MDRDPKTIEKTAAGLVGIPFAPGGRDPRVGLDCWGVVIEFYRRVGIDLPDPVSVESATCEAAPVAHLFRPIPVSEARPGDVGRFSVRDAATGHLGVVLSGRRILHPVDRAGVVVWPLRLARVETCYRYCGDDAEC